MREMAVRALALSLTGLACSLSLSKFNGEERRAAPLVRASFVVLCLSLLSVALCTIFDV